jgi:hypothetical protein
VPVVEKLQLIQALVSVARVEMVYLEEAMPVVHGEMVAQVQARRVAHRIQALVSHQIFQAHRWNMVAVEMELWAPRQEMPEMGQEVTTLPQLQIVVAADRKCKWMVGAAEQVATALSLCVMQLHVTQHQQLQQMVTRSLLLQMLEVVLGKFQMELQVFGLLQLVAEAQQVLELQINGGAQAVAAVKLLLKLFQLIPEIH